MSVLAPCLLPLVVLVATAPLHADADSIGKALREGEWNVKLRYRIEFVDSDALSKDGTASTLRSALLYRSAWYRSFQLGVSVEDVTDVLGERLHANGGAGALSNGIVDRPAIVDPDNTEMEQAWLAWRGGRGTRIQAGRSSINLGNERFVGTVGWRQGQQSLDSASLYTEAIPKTHLTYVRAWNVNRINGGNLDVEADLLHAEIDLGLGTLAPYYHRLDFGSPSFVALSTATLGGAWYGVHEIGRGWSLPFRVEYARQDDAGANPGNIDTDYTDFELGGGWKAWKLSAGVETLGADPLGAAFSTPLATLHKFNGWADVFATTPPQGLEDRSLTLDWSKGSWAATAVYHDFDSDRGSLDYGSELDAQVTWMSSWGQGFGLKSASYAADGPGSDTKKIWLWTSYEWGQSFVSR